MTWRWVAEPVGPPAELDQVFASQGEAETWLGEFYPGLVEAGVRTVTLYEEDRRVYGPMSLESEIG